MPPPKVKRQNEEIAGIVRQVLGSMTLGEAEIRLDHRLSTEAIRRLKSGKVGRESTIRVFADGFRKELCEYYGDEIRARFGECDPASFAPDDWLAEKAGFVVDEEPEDSEPLATRRQVDELAQKMNALIERLPGSGSGVDADWAALDEQLANAVRKASEVFTQEHPGATIRLHRAQVLTRDLDTAHHALETATRELPSIIGYAWSVMEETHLDRWMGPYFWEVVGTPDDGTALLLIVEVTRQGAETTAFGSGIDERQLAYQLLAEGLKSITAEFNGPVMVDLRSLDRWDVEDVRRYLGELRQALCEMQRG